MDIGIMERLVLPEVLDVAMKWLRTASHQKQSKKKLLSSFTQLLFAKLDLGGKPRMLGYPYKESASFSSL